MRTLTLLAVVIIQPLQMPAQQEAPFPPAPSTVSSTVSLVSESEEGNRLVISGTVFRSDGKTLYPDLVVYLYQTDATGVYNKSDRSWKRPRLHGWIKTGKNGKYEIRTIKPGSYPGSRNPAHIHAIVRLPNEDAKWIDDFLFDGDPYLGKDDHSRFAEKGSFSSIMKATRDASGILHCVRDIRIH